MYVVCIYMYVVNNILININNNIDYILINIKNNINNNILIY